MSTKYASYLRTIDTLGEKQRLVYEAIDRHRGASRSELATLTGLRLSSVCGRVNELVASGMVRPCGVKWDADTARNVETLEAINFDENGQGRLI